ncbi:protein FANTASTIC FOUR 1-like isoform X2 [Rhodamnia argentea]|uniref:Protein FANTASTIC FOUR 1-like isoform X2 n=1 Tax=Rhodamnia argentea TaxID=178133 RepID=A0A8B8R2H1_9MYRT|nr:protein FANTASTIC FOUR 1-like isoform X2 [Rhodamnia argentea]
MSSSVCQGLQSCLEPRRVEPRVLRLKLSLRRPFVDSDGVAKMKTVAAQLGADPADWSFLQAFAPREEKSEGEHGAVYVHPLLKCSASFLSDRSLEMCTESLGSETGSDVGDSEAPLLSPGGGRGGGADRRPAIRPERKKLSRSGSFPPPLTSVGGSTGFQVRSRREGGRLVVEAVAVSSGCSVFHVERSHGRLRVRFSEGSKAEGEEEEEEDKEVEAESKELEEEEEEEDEEEEENEEGEGMEGNRGFVGGEIGNGQCSRPSMVWCNEGVAINWKPKPCWVAT